MAKKPPNMWAIEIFTRIHDDYAAGGSKNDVTRRYDSQLQA